MMKRVLYAAAGLAFGLTFLGAPAQARSTFHWYTMHACQFYPGGGIRAPAEVAACWQQMRAGNALRLCRDQMRRGPVPCEPDQATVWIAPR
jgi:hypothetical protein